MSTHHPRSIAIFESMPHALEAVQQLETEGFGPEQVSLLMLDTSEGRRYLFSDGNKVAQSVVRGSAVGGVVAALAAGALALPGIGVIAAGPLLAMLTGAGAGAVSGGLLASLIGLGIPRNEAVLRVRDLQQGGVLVGVDHLDSVAEKDRADAILRQHSPVVLVGEDDPEHPSRDS